jgi:hypothetical protein
MFVYTRKIAQSNLFAWIGRKRREYNRVNLTVLYNQVCVYDLTGNA